MKTMKTCCLIISLLFAIGCSSSRAEEGTLKAVSEDSKKRSQAMATSYQSVLIEGVPHVEQKPDFCGEACVEMFSSVGGAGIDQDTVFGLAGVDPALGRGAYTKEMKAALLRIGYDIGDVWHRVEVARLDHGIEALWSALHKDLQDGVPSIVCTRYDEQPDTTEHFRLILGYDSASDEVIYHEPAQANGAYLRMSRTKFLSLWPLKYDAQAWTVIRFRLAGDPSFTAERVEGGFSPADYAQGVMALKERIPKGFTVLVEPPFIVIGDDSPEAVEASAVGTVRWAVEKLKREYFQRDPSRLLSVWLFKDGDSYRRHTESIFQDDPGTPYGYYSEQHEALIMNIGTGGGTLVHEIVHPFLDANFPGHPPWFNEGLASLYEQSGERGGRIIGRTNWRLEGLKEAIEADGVPTFKALMTQDVDEFYDDPYGTNYAQSRYLLYYLQEEGLLRRYYDLIQSTSGQDPTGYLALAQVLGRQDLDVFQDEWTRYVMGLKFRGR